MTKQAAKAPSEGEQAELELRSHFAGRRDGQRIAFSLPVELVCVERNVAARTIDISSITMVFTRSNSDFTLYEILGSSMSVPGCHPNVRSDQFPTCR